MKKTFIILFMLVAVYQADAEVVYTQRYQDTSQAWRDIGNRTIWPWQYNLEISPGNGPIGQIPEGFYPMMELSILSDGNFGWSSWSGMLLMDNFFDNTNWYGALLGDTFFAQNDLSGADFRNAFSWGDAEFAYNYYYEGNPPLFDPGYTYTDDEIYMVGNTGGSGPNIPEPATFMIGVIAAFALLRRKNRLDKKK